MKFYVDFWRRIGFAFELWRYRPEMDSLGYLFLRLWFKKYQLTVDLYRNRKGWFSFHINLPLFNLMNDVRQEALSTGTDSQYKVVPVITGKVFWKSINCLRPKGGM